MKNVTIKILKFYKKSLSPVLKSAFGGGCRFTPSCSEYTITSLERFGFWKGISLGTKRILKCNPWGGFGEDPAPIHLKH